MRYVFYTNSVSPHQLPLARALVKLLGAEEYRYVYTTSLAVERRNLGWERANESWIIAAHDYRYEVRELLLDAKMLMSGLRDNKLFESRAVAGLATVYCCERWFKPGLGILRLLNPSYLRMALKFVRLLRKSDKVLYYPMGIHAARDMARLCGLMHGDLRCLFRAPKLEFERVPGGKIFNRVERVETCRGGDGKYCLDKMRMWGYFVEDSRQSSVVSRQRRLPLTSLKVLWVGRLLKWKRVDTIICAVGEISIRSTRSTRLNISLDIYGTGPEEARLNKLASKYGDVIKLHPPVPIGAVRKLMREHDVYVLSSNAYEGWGAVVSESLEEGMLTIGTYEAGSSATILPESHLFHAGDWQALARLLRKAANGELKPTGIGAWTAKFAASQLISSEASL